MDALSAAATGLSPEGPKRSGGGAKRLDEPGAEAISGNRNSRYPHEFLKRHFS